MDDLNPRLTTRPTEQVIAAIQALDVESVKTRLMDPVRGEGWAREHADAIEISYKNFLTMLVKHPEDAEEIALSEDTDEFWHTHILQTIKYADDCQEIFGNFLHHSPHLEEITSEYLEKKLASVEKTRRLYEREFGSAMDDAWSGNAAASGASMKAANAAASGASIRATNAAASGATIKTGNAAASGASIRAGNAAASGASIRATNAAASGATVKAGNAAASGASIKAGNAAASGASIRATKAAASGAVLRARVKKAAAGTRRANTARFSVPMLKAA